MKVLMIGSYPTEGCGISKYTEELLESLIDYNVDVTSKRIFFFKDKLTLFKWIRILSAIVRDKPNIIHIQYTPPICGPYFPVFLLLLQFLFRGEVKAVITAHEKPSTYYRHLNGPIKILFKVYEQIVLRYCSAVIVHIDEHKFEILENYTVEDDKIWTIPHCVMDNITPNADITKRFIETNNLSNRCIITTLGFIRPSKGIEFLLEAVSKIRHYHDITLFVAGATTDHNISYLNELKKLSKRLKLDDIVLFTGHLTDEEIPSLLSISNVIVLPYLYATQSGVLHRSVPYCKPFVATNVGGLGETVKKYNIGELVAPGDSEALAEAILKLLSVPELATEYRNNCLKMAKELSQSEIAKMHIALYKSIINS